MYQEFSKRTALELRAVRSGNWLSRNMEITDDLYSYGKLSYSGLFKHDIVVETSGQKWRFIASGAWRKDLEIVDENDTTVAFLSTSWWGMKSTLTFPDGKTMQFSRPSAWKNRFVWTDPARGEVMELDGKAFTRDVVITFKDDLKNNPWLLLLAFLGLHRIMVARRQAAAST
ncbi:hypothetical protein [Hufsiella ginkgonis]|uniref:Uncharacterized protein n=1 Tax=Hufsiella ginkgonis TaxID=2695274 RepID=A0A7K1XXC6_9SPHI|nr:hypothetical protein [Hufsiella ginkgonis]MXV15664.1 hypothetical protein [Hufsiella ginkgonis]